MYKIWSIFSQSAETEATTFFVRANHEQEARDLVLAAMEKIIFKTKLANSESRGCTIDKEDVFADGNVVIISSSPAPSFNLHEEFLNADLSVVDATATVRMMVHYLSMNNDKPNLITAVAEETDLAKMYRLHLPRLLEWLEL